MVFVVDFHADSLTGISIPAQVTDFITDSITDFSAAFRYPLKTHTCGATAPNFHAVEKSSGCQNLLVSGVNVRTTNLPQTSIRQETSRVNN